MVDRKNLLSLLGNLYNSGIERDSDHAVLILGTIFKFLGLPAPSSKEIDYFYTGEYISE